ncbi:metal-dependent hydrolase [Cyanothece sp. BG0011]|uniref:metal-dependent hydrolase n=1 Tax=Cyanothece sp. BG0011 TaxID=2082950 RepID=UPI000D1EA75E|nr:metal-dependent hydrolase [Cyanothece sp. BG0011]
MASPIGHSLAGCFGFLLVRENPQFLKYFSSKQLLITGIIMANLPDTDFLLGYLFYQNFNAIHRQFTHSFFVGFVVCIVIFVCLRFFKPIPLSFLVWFWGLYFSHILLDMLAYDRYLPAGVQCFLPFSSNYFAFPISIIGGLSLTGGIIQLNNFLTILQEIVVIPLLFWAILFLTKTIYKNVQSHN